MKRFKDDVCFLDDEQAAQRVPVRDRRQAR
jgi:hypothetical protein